LSHGYRAINPAHTKQASLGSGDLVFGGPTSKCLNWRNASDHHAIEVPDKRRYRDFFPELFLWTAKGFWRQADCVGRLVSPGADSDAADGGALFATEAR
jgi:hypothetical protein